MENTNLSETEISNTNNDKGEDVEVIDELSILKVQYAELQQRFNVIEQEFEVQKSLYLNTFSDSSFVSMVKSANNYKSWFGFLPEACKRFLVVLTVKDTAGNNMPDFVYKTLVKSGFTNIRKELWNTYVGIIYQNSVWCNDRHTNEEKTSYLYESLDGKFKLAAYSEAWNNGNKGDILINGRQFAVNIRGLNVVVYDLKDNKLVDSIGFDSHEMENFIFKR